MVFQIHLVSSIIADFYIELKMTVKGKKRAAILTSEEERNSAIKFK